MFKESVFSQKKAHYKIPKKYKKICYLSRATAAGCPSAVEI